jgi:hypothetical protein
MPIKFSKEIYEKITNISKELGIPRTQFVTMAVLEWIRNNK